MATHAITNAKSHLYFHYEPSTSMRPLFQQSSTTNGKKVRTQNWQPHQTVRTAHIAKNHFHEFLIAEKTQAPHPPGSNWHHYTKQRHHPHMDFLSPFFSALLFPSSPSDLLLHLSYDRTPANETYHAQPYAPHDHETIFLPLLLRALLYQWKYKYPPVTHRPPIQTTAHLSPCLHCDTFY